LNKSFASKLRKVLVAAVSGALALSTISVMPASAAGPVYATGDALSESSLSTNAPFSQNGEVTIPENVGDVSVDLSFQLAAGFFSSNLGKTIAVTRKVTGPNNVVIVSGSDYSVNGSPYFNFCEQGFSNCKNSSGAQPPATSQVVLANQATGSIQLYSSVYRMSGPNSMGPLNLPAGTYKFEFTLTADGAPVTVDGTDVKINNSFVRYSIRTANNYTVAPGVTSVSMSAATCIDSAKIAVGDVITPTLYVNDTAAVVQGWDIYFNTRGDDAPDPRQMNGGANQMSATVTQGDIDYGLSARVFKNQSANVVAGATFTWAIAAVDQDGNDVTGSCVPGAAGKPTLAFESMTNRLVATVTSPAKFAEGTRCEFYKSTDLTTVVATSWAWSNMANSPATCQMNQAIPGTSYVVKVVGMYYTFLGLPSPASDAVLVPAPGITVSPAISGVTDEAGKVSVVSNDIAHFTGNFGTRVIADGKGGALRGYTFQTGVTSCPPNCGPPAYSFKVMQSTATGLVPGFAGTGTVEFAPTGVGGGNMLLGWYGATADKWTLGATTIDPSAQGASQIELLQGTNASAATTSTKINRAEVQATCDELGAGYTTASSANSTGMGVAVVSAPTAKQLLLVTCFKPTTINNTSAYLPNPILVTVDGNNALTLVKALGENSASVNSTQVSMSANPNAGANGVALTVFATKKNVTGFANFAETAGTVEGREIVRLKSDLTSTVTTSGWTSAGTSVTNEPFMLAPQVNDGDFFFIQRVSGMPSSTFKLGKVGITGAAGSTVDLTVDKAVDLPNANFAFPIGVQAGSASAIQLIVSSAGMGPNAATSVTIASVNTTTGSGKAGEIVKYTTSGQSFSIANSFVLDAVTSDVNWWFANASVAVDKLSVYEWRNHLYVKPSGPVPAVTSKNLEYATNTPAAGTKVTFTGTNLNLATAVKFGAVAATLGTKTATSLEVTVPAGTGTVAITIESANGNAAAGNFTYVGVNKVTQSVTLNAGANTAAVGDADRTLVATVSMTGYTAVASLTYTSSTPSVCTVTGNKLKFVGKGLCSVTAMQAGSSWAAEGGAARDISVSGPDAQTITIKTPSTGERMISLDGFFIYPSTNSGQPLSIRFDTPTVCKKGTYGATHVVNVKTGSCKITVSAAGNAQWMASTKVLTYTVAKAGTTKITDAGNVTAPVVLNGNGAKTNVLSEVISWKKSTGALTIASKSVWVGPITATATIKVGSKTYSCTVKYGTLKAASATSVKTIASPAALCAGKTASEKAALAALKKLNAPMTVKIVVVRDLRNPTKYTTKGQSIARAVYVTIG
jgi:hypothetical protein